MKKHEKDAQTVETYFAQLMSMAIITLFQPNLSSIHYAFEEKERK